MFRWAAAQSLPSRLGELLDRAEAASCPWGSRTPDVVVLFLPPHLLTEADSMPHEVLRSVYELTCQACDDPIPPPLINGERLLSFTAEELQDWSPDRPLPRPATLQSVPVFSGVFTRALIDADPKLEEQYQWLDHHSLRGGAEPEPDYYGRLACTDPASLVEAWNQINEERNADTHLSETRQQLTALEDEFEQYMLDSRETARKLSWNREGRGQALELLAKQDDLFQKLLTLQARMALCGSL
jgi:hypothetical protein